MGPGAGVFMEPLSYQLTVDYGKALAIVCSVWALGTILFFTLAPWVQGAVALCPHCISGPVAWCPAMHYRLMPFT